MIRTSSKGTALVWLLVAIVILTILAAIFLPNFVRAVKERALRKDLDAINEALIFFKVDNGQYPATLGDLTKASKSEALTADGIHPVNSKHWHGPYLTNLGNDPISGEPFKYKVDPKKKTGKAISSAGGISLKGTPYSSW